MPINLSFIGIYIVYPTFCRCHSESRNVNANLIALIINVDSCSVFDECRFLLYKYIISLPNEGVTSTKKKKMVDATNAQETFTVGLSIFISLNFILFARTHIVLKRRPMVFN